MLEDRVEYRASEYLKWMMELNYYTGYPKGDPRITFWKLIKVKFPSGNVYMSRGAWFWCIQKYDAN